MGKHKGGDVEKVEHLLRRREACLAICAGKDCARGGARQVILAAEAALQEAGLAETHRVALTKCQDYCDDGPTVTVVPGGLTYIGMTPEAARQVVFDHVRDGRPVLASLPKKLRRKLERRQL